MGVDEVGKMIWIRNCHILYILYYIVVSSHHGNHRHTICLKYTWPLFIIHRMNVMAQKWLPLATASDATVILSQIEVMQVEGMQESGLE